jgi:hypothetical protein
VFVYKSTHDSKNLGSLGCVMLTKPYHSNCFLCVLVSKSLCFSTTSSHFMWSRQANCGLASIVLCCIGNHPDTVEFWDDLSASDVCRIFLLEFSIYLFDLSCLFAGHRSWFHVNLISRYSVRTNLTLFKVVIRAGPWSDLFEFFFKLVQSFELFGCH